MDKQSTMQHMPIQYDVTPYQTAQNLPPVVRGTFQQSPTSSYVQAAHAFSLSAHPNQLAYQHQLHQHQQQQLLHHQKQQIEIFWANQMQGIEQAVDFRNHSLPLARIKKIMKSDEDVRMISAEAPVVFAKACEMFINELTLRAWIHTEENRRRTLQKNDIAAAIASTDIFDFLVDIVPRDELKEEPVINLGTPTSSLSVASSGSNAAGANSFPFYYLPNQHSGPHGVIVGKPMDSAIYMQQPRSPVAYMHNMLQPGHMHADQSRSPNSG